MVLAANLAGTTVEMVVVEVSAADIDPTLVFNIAAEDGTATGILSIPTGSERLIAVRGFNGDGIETHQGSAIADVVPGANPPLSILLVPLTGELPIEVSIAHISILIEPASVALEVGETEQLVATVLDLVGEPIAADVLWATSHPGVAIVDQTGLVTGVGVGEAQIVATYDGVAGLAVVEVEGEAPACVDADGDGFDSVVCGGSDCDDSNPDVNPAIVEDHYTNCGDGIDHDCDGVDPFCVEGMIYGLGYPTRHVPWWLTAEPRQASLRSSVRPGSPNPCGALARVGT
jgi:hypothetical protein